MGETNSDRERGEVLHPRIVEDKTKTFSWVVAVTEPPAYLARMTIVMYASRPASDYIDGKQKWDGEWVTKQGRVWPDPDADDGA